VIVERSLKFVSEYTRTVLSELQVATMGRVGCGAVSHARSREGGVRSERRVRFGLAMARTVAIQDVFSPARDGGGGGNLR
jgi:hypothetical protein